MENAVVLALIAALGLVAAAFALTAWRRHMRTQSYGNAILAQRQPERSRNDR